MEFLDIDVSKPVARIDVYRVVCTKKREINVLALTFRQSQKTVGSFNAKVVHRFGLIRLLFVQTVDILTCNGIANNRNHILI